MVYIRPKTLREVTHPKVWMEPIRKHEAEDDESLFKSYCSKYGGKVRCQELYGKKCVCKLGNVAHASKMFEELMLNPKFKPEGKYIIEATYDDSMCEYVIYPTDVEYPNDVVVREKMGDIIVKKVILPEPPITKTRVMGEECYLPEAIDKINQELDLAGIPACRVMHYGKIFLVCKEGFIEPYAEDIHQSKKVLKDKIMRAMRVIERYKLKYFGPFYPR